MAQAAEQPQYQPLPGSPQYVMVPVAQSNGLGVFGFFTALIGLFIPTGIVALLGLLICLVALGRSPRGFAMMGLLIGLVGSAIWLVIDIAVILVGLIAVIGIGVFSAAGFMLTQPEVVEITGDMINTSIAVEHYHETQDGMPSSLDELGLSAAALVDPWGTKYRYELIDRSSDSNSSERHNGPNFEITSAGPDMAFGTEDDIMLSKLDRLWEEAFETFEDKMEQFSEKVETLQQNGRYAYSYGDGSCGSVTIGRSGADVVVAPAQPDVPQPPAASAESYAGSYERRAAEQLQAEVADQPDAAVDEPADQPEPSDEPDHGPV